MKISRRSSDEFAIQNVLDGSSLLVLVSIEMLRYLIFTIIVLSTVDSHRSLRGEYIRSQARASALHRIHGAVRTRPAIAVTSADQLSDTVTDLFFPPLPGQSNNDFHPQLRRLPADNETLYYYSWHIHMYFFHENVNVTARALAIRKEFMSYFNIETCLGNCFMGAIFDNCTRMCVWDPVLGVDGPHPYGQWGVYLPNELLDGYTGMDVSQSWRIRSLVPSEYGRDGWRSRSRSTSDVDQRDSSTRLGFPTLVTMQMVRMQ